MIICAGKNETFPFAQTVGVGLIESAINLTKICIEKSPKSILFIGSAGSYGKYKVFDIVESKSASNIELSYLEDYSYTPIENRVISDTILTKSEIIVNSSNYISINENLSKKFLQDNILLENMEFFSVLSVANKFNIPAFGVFIITNYANKRAHSDFLINHKEAMQKLIKYLQEKDLIKKEQIGKI